MPVPRIQMEHPSPSSKALESVVSLLLLVASLGCRVSPGPWALSHDSVQYTHAKSFLTLCDPMNCSPPDSSVHGILQARILDCHSLLQGIFPIQGLNPPGSPA